MRGHLSLRLAMGVAIGVLQVLCLVYAPGLGPPERHPRAATTATSPGVNAQCSPSACTHQRPAAGSWRAWRNGTPRFAVSHVCPPFSPHRRSYFLGKSLPYSGLGLIDNAAASGDHFLPGSPFESWAFGEIGGGSSFGSRSGNRFTGQAGSNTLTLTPGAGQATAVFEAISADGKLGLRVSHELRDASSFVRMSITITNRHSSTVKPYYTRK